MNSALRIAAGYGHLDIIRYLVDHGVNLHSRGDVGVLFGLKRGETALLSAAENGHLDTVKYLIEQGVNIHAFYNNALIGATENDHLDMVKYLIEQNRRFN